MSTKLQTIHLNDFTGGLDTYNPAAELPINTSPDLDNITVLKNGLKKRQGDVEFNGTIMSGGGNVQGLGYFKPTSGTEYLVSICGAKTFKSDSLDGTMDDITGVTTSTGQDYIWTHSILNNLSIWVGGNREAPIKWNGAGNTAALGGSPNSGSFGFTTRDRMFIGSTAANPSTLYWSILANPEDWSGTGSGSQTVVTNDGDELIGGTPLNNDVTLLFKKYSIHQLITQTAPFPIKPLNIGMGCVGKNALVQAKGLVYFVTNEPRMKATDGYQIFDFPNSIDDLWDGLTKSRLPYIQGIYYPVLNQIHWYCSYGSSATANNYCIIWDLNYKCWLRYTTGYDINVACLASGYRLMGGHTNGKIYEKDKSATYLDASESNAGVNGYWYTSWIRGKSNQSVLHPRYMDINYEAQSAIGSINYSYGFNYLKDSNAGYFSSITTGSLWGTGVWDTDVWGTRPDSQKRVFMYGRGNNFQLKLYNSTANEKLVINSVSIALQQDETKEITNV